MKDRQIKQYTAVPEIWSDRIHFNLPVWIKTNIPRDYIFVNAELLITRQQAHPT